jgi:nicotinamidase/pyrazinamidase
MKNTIGVIVGDIQGDFTEWKKGSLAVPNTGSDYVKQAEEVTKRLHDAGLPIFGVQDWHPMDHISFYTSHPGTKPLDTIEIDGRTQVLWPPHCVQGTENARILVDNKLFLAIVQKGKDKQYDSYSAFQDDGGHKTEMEAILRQNGIEKVVLYGIATDYCVRATALDAIRTGFQVTVIEELCRGVAPDTSEEALEEMKGAGAIILETFNLNRIKGQ